jgi:ligand-binding sensor domain-containing protein
MVATDCSIDQVCDLGACKVQTCMPGGAVTCPPGYACQPNKQCQRLFSDAGTLDAGQQMMGNFDSLALLSTEITLSTGSPGLTNAQIPNYYKDATFGVKAGDELYLSIQNGKITSLKKEGANGPPSEDITSLIVDRDGALWAGTPAGLARYQGGRWTRYSQEQGLLTDNIGYLLEDDQSCL